MSKSSRLSISYDGEPEQEYENIVKSQEFRLKRGASFLNFDEMLEGLFTVTPKRQKSGNFSSRKGSTEILPANWTKDIASQNITIELLYEDQNNLTKS